MDARDALAVLALTLDLVGGFLLSLPLVWNVDAAIRVLEGVISHAHAFASGLYSPSRIVTGLLATAVTGVIAVAFSDDDLVRVLTGGAGAVAGGILVGILLLVATSLLERFLRWVKRGNREVQMGRVGFGLFFCGLVLQGVHNLTS